MKKILIPFFLHLSLVSFAQMSFGVKGGLNVSNIAFKDSDVPVHVAPNDFFVNDTEASVGFHAGVYGKISLTGGWSLISELQFTRRGYSFHADFPSADKTQIHLNYVELPLLISYAPIKWLAIDLGPDASYMLSAVEKKSSTYNVDEYYEDHKIDFGLVGGLRFNVSEKISIVGRYYFGLKPIAEIEFRDQNNSAETLKTYNRSAQFGVSYQLLK